MTSKDENATKARVGMAAAKKFLQNWEFTNIVQVDNKKRVDKKRGGL